MSQKLAEDIIDTLMDQADVDDLELVTYVFDQLDHKLAQKFVDEIADRYELYTIDQARDAIMDDHNI